MFKINYKYFLNGLKITITLLSLVYLIHVFGARQNILTEIYFELTSEKSSYQWFSLFLSVFLISFNMGFEAAKWHYLSTKLEKTSFASSLKSILVGCTLGLITPQALGDYASRLYFLKSKHVKEAVGLVFLTRISQFYITVFYGIIAFVSAQHLFQFESTFFSFYTLLLLVIVAFLSLVFLVYTSSIVIFSRKNVYLKKIIPYIIGIAKCRMKDLGFVLVFSWLRFMIFTAQYLLLLYYFGVDVFQMVVVLCIWLTFFTKSIFPAIGFFSEITLREAAAIYFFTKAGIEIDKVILASLSLWTLNNILPSFAGLFVIIGINNRKIQPK